MGTDFSSLPMAISFLVHSVELACNMKLRWVPAVKSCDHAQLCDHVLASRAEPPSMIEPWVFEFVPELGGPNTEPNPNDVANLLARYFDLWVRDETLGFTGIFFSERHFGRSCSPSANLLIAALAPRTTRPRLGVMGVQHSELTCD